MPAVPTRRATRLTQVFLGLLALRVGLWGVTYAWSAAPYAFGKAVATLQVVGLSVGMIVGLIWLSRAWARVPARWRRAYDDRRIEPGEAVWKLFIPIYGVYWMFLANIGLCGAIERHLERSGARPAKAPSTLAFVTCLTQLVPLANLLVAPFLWGVFMARVDAAQTEAERLDPDAPPPEPVPLLATLGMAVVGLLLGWGALMLTFLAIWQFLSPAGPPPAP